MNKSLFFQGCLLSLVEIGDRPTAEFDGWRIELTELFLHDREEFRFPHLTPNI